MRVLKSFLVLTIAILGFSFINVQAQNSSGNSPIEQKVFKKIIGLPYYGVFDNIKYEVQGNTVILSGKVYSLGVKNSAENVVKKIDGVERVINNIENLPPSSFDNSIRRNIVRSFANNGGNLSSYLRGPNPSIRIIVDNGQVALEGYVSNRGDYNLANILANGIPGVFSVTNNLVIEKDSPR